MPDYLAHSSQNGYPAQTYKEHVENVINAARKYAEEAETFTASSHGQLCSSVYNAAILHDLGKLCDENQSVLHHPQGESHLPFNHVDAGTASLLQDADFLSAATVYSHHRGLPDMCSEELRGEHFFRDSSAENRSKTDQLLNRLTEIHRSLVPLPIHPASTYSGDHSVFLRLALSCLADADHSDTARHYGQIPGEPDFPALKPAERLSRLDHYVNKLGGNDERSRLRRTMYENCRNAEISSDFAACDSPVGSGKTTAVMAHLLAQAIRRKARHIFVILPYTSIITQSVNVYRKYLTLPGENPETVVAELHSRADFDDISVRYLSSLWRSPIIVTTAVAFFETLASAQPSALRKLHELPGSILFIDEAHAALPVRLLPLAWHWMKKFADEWGCYWILASGSLVRYWTIPELIKEKEPVPDLVDSALREKLLIYEKHRITFQWTGTPLSRTDLIQLVTKAPGPRLLIVNTVQNAAILADDIRKIFGRERVEHLSTALTPYDRSITIRRIETRLQDPSDTDWTLVATSCVEAGVDFSFRTGFREVSSLLSLLQAAGRVNRHGKEEKAQMWSFTLQDSSVLNKNRHLQTSAEVLKSYLNERVNISPELSTRSMKDELTRDDHCLKFIRKLMQDETAGQFKTVCDEFEVIDTQTVTVVADQNLIGLIKQGKSDWRQLQLHSFAISEYNIAKWNVHETAKGIYEWTLPYDSFIGYMAGVLTKLKLE